MAGIATHAIPSYTDAQMNPLATTCDRETAIDRIARATVAAMNPDERRARAREEWEVIETSEEAAEYPDDLRAAFASGVPSDDACFEVLLPLERFPLEGALNEYLERRMLALTGMHVSVTGEAAAGAVCPCCWYVSLPEDSFFQICRVCFWQNDGGHAGANAVSLEESRASFERIGAVEERFVGVVLPDGPERYRRVPESERRA